MPSNSSRFKNKMIQDIKNGTKLVEAFCEQRNRFETIKTKAEQCRKLNQDIESLRVECRPIFEAVLKNFNPEKKPLKMFLLKTNYDNTGKMKKWLFDKVDGVVTQNRWYYQELCLNIIGLSLMPTYGEKSYSIIEHDIDVTTYNLSSLKDKEVQARLKVILKQEKFELLNKLLQDIELLTYEGKLKKEVNLKYTLLNDDRGAFKKEAKNFKYMEIDAESPYVSCKLYNAKAPDYRDRDLSLTSLGFQDAIIAEQFSEEIITLLDECEVQLEEKKKVIGDYVQGLKDKFIKELICMNLKPKKVEM